MILTHRLSINSVTHAYENSFISKYINTYSQYTFLGLKHIHHIHSYEINTFIIYPMTQYLTWKPIREKTTKALFIWHEKYMAPFVHALSCKLCSRSSSLIYTYSSLLSCSLFLYFSYLLYCWSAHNLDQLLFSLTLLLIRTQPVSSTLLTDTTNWLETKKSNNK